MNLSDKAVDEFKKIYESKFSEKLTEGEYRIRAENFLRLMYLICKPIPKTEVKSKSTDAFTKRLAATLLSQAEGELDDTRRNG